MPEDWKQQQSLTVPFVEPFAGRCSSKLSAPRLCSAMAEGVEVAGSLGSGEVPGGTSSATNLYVPDQPGPVSTDMSVLHCMHGRKRMRHFSSVVRTEFRSTEQHQHHSLLIVCTA